MGFNNFKWLTGLCFMFLLGACTDNAETKVIENEDVHLDEGQGKIIGLLDNVEVKEFTLENINGMKAVILNYGGAIKSLMVPDKNGTTADVVLGFDSLGSYLQSDNPYMGALIGRYANRIANAYFILNEMTYGLEANDNGNSLHGGIKGLDKVVWAAQQDNNSLQLNFVSIDGEGGYPGNLDIQVVYELTDDNELKISYTATTDKPTPVNLTNHSYFNLSGKKSSGILGHELYIKADNYTPVNEMLIPTGEIKKTAGTPFDFTTPKEIGRDIEQVPGGYDHNFVITREDKNITLVASLFDRQSGRLMEVLSTEPGLQFYSGNFLDGSLTGKENTPYHKYAGLCLEPQQFPDAPNQPAFPNTILQPGETYKQTTIYKFSIK